MKTRILLSVIVSGVLLLASYGFEQRAGKDPLDRIALAKFKDALIQDGFDVTPGEASIWNLVDQWCSYTEGVSSAWYSNNEPYLQFKVPISAGSNQLNPVFQLREDEAIVVIGLTPPPERYFSYTPFLASKVYPGGRKPMFATLGDSINIATIKTIGPTPFNAPVVLIFTPDQSTDARVRKALERAGYPAAIINTSVFPASMLTLGYGPGADEFRILPRNGIWLDKIASEAYLNHPPLQVFRVTPRTSADPDPFPAPALRVRGTGQTEMYLMNKLEQLREGIIAAHPGLVASDLPVAPGLYEGSDFIQRGADPWGDGRDCFYVSSGYVPEIGTADKLTLADDEFLIVYGPNHVATGKATYMNVNIYASETPTETPKLSIGTLDDRDFTNNTAGPYLPAGDPAAKLMFAYKVSRSGVAEPNCLQLTVPEDCPRLKLDSSTILGIGIRTYLEPATAVGPAMSEILYNRVIKFSPRP